jgi:hypothetical protein
MAVIRGSLAGHLQAAASFKVLLRQKYLDVPNACHVGNVLLDECAPLGRELAPANRIAGVPSADAAPGTGRESRIQ